MSREDTIRSKEMPVRARHILEVIAGAWVGEQPDFHKLFLFDRLTRGGKDWNFLIVTRASGPERLELAAYSFEVGPEGELKSRLESRKAQIPAARLAEVVEGILLRLDEVECDYREIDLGQLAGAESRLELLSQLLGENAESTLAGEPGTDGLQPGQSSRETG